MASAIFAALFFCDSVRAGTFFFEPDFFEAVSVKIKPPYVYSDMRARSYAQRYSDFAKRV